VFLGTGTAGAYHAGVLRALTEAGVRIDVVAGRGMGAVGAFFAAADAGARLWEPPTGLWTGPRPPAIYRLRPLWRALAACGLLAAAALVLPIVLGLGLAVLYPFVLIAQLLAPGTGAGMLVRYREWVALLFSPALLSSLIPRVATAAVMAGALLAAGAWVAGAWRRTTRRRTRGAALWDALGLPLDAAGAVGWAIDGFWQFIRGAAAVGLPPARDLSRRFADLVQESLGQPGYREFLVVAHDLDANHDLVFALLAPAFRDGFHRGEDEGGRGDRALDVVDLAGAGRDHVVDALGAALAVPGACEPHRLAFAQESAWRGETHRVCDRPGAATRLLDEVAAAGATQVILATGGPGGGVPHALRAARVDPVGRAGEIIASMEAAAVEEAVAACAHRFWGIYRIAPEHAPLGPFDLAGAYDEASDRPFTLAELAQRGYEDAYRQFIEPVVGAGGESMHQPAMAPASPSDDLPLHP
jgi:hypothetical protein